MELKNKFGISILVMLLLTLPILAACSSEDDGESSPPAQPTASPTDTVTPAEKSTITIGHHTDKTGFASAAMETVDLGLADVIRYYNDNNLIPGIKVKLVEYDGQIDPARDKPGWEWLKERGADVIMGFLPNAGPGLQGSAEDDKIPLFVANGLLELVEIPGYMFVTAPLLEDQAWNLISWIMENDWDWQTNGPAKVGGAGDEASNFHVIYEQFEKYAEMYPERMEWVGGHIIPTGIYQWDVQVEALKDCDYIYPTNIFPFFVKDYFRAGHSKAKFIGTDSHTPWNKLVEDMGLWEEIDGMLYIAMTEEWAEDAEFMNLMTQILREYHPGSYEEVIHEGKGYGSVVNGMMVLESIKIAAEAVGPENVDSQAIYEAAQSMTLSFDGIQRYSFSETKRAAPDRLAIYEMDSSNKKLVRVSDWLPIEPAQ
ncbi:MAG: ABC transporter substrate-binding protein [Chloroflexi bacterium]|nr:ABC transporter substrate-binding protein [Chloroflexota bacterium]